MAEKIETTKKSVFATLNAINCNDKTEKKNGLTYLSWAWAWAEVKKAYPNAAYTIYEWVNQYGCPQNYFTDGRTCWVKTGVTIDGLEHIEELPVMDFRNASIPADKVTSFDVNKAIQRSLTKAAARHGLGLYIYAGEDLPEDAEQQPKPAPRPAAPKAAPQGLKKGQTITREMVEQGACNALIANLRIYVGKPEYQAKAAAMQTFYKWDSIETYNTICRKACEA